MKARALQKILETNRTVHETHDSINVASSLCPELISLNKKTLKLTYALDTFKKGRASLGSIELECIWDKLEELVKIGDIHDFINGDDVIETPLSVYHAVDSVIVESSTDKYGWPNVTASGLLMYDNTFFETRDLAANDLKKTLISYINSLNQRITKMNDEVVELKKKVAVNEDSLSLLSD